MGNNENWALQMKRDFADLICLLCHCDSYHRKISLPWVETSTAEACKGAVNGVSQGALPSYFYFSCVIFSSSYLERPAGIHQFSKGRCFLRMHLSCWVRYDPFPFYKPVHRSSWRTWIQTQAHCWEKLIAFPECCPVSDMEHHWAPGSCFTHFSSDLSYLAFQRHLALALGIFSTPCRDTCLQEWFKTFEGAIFFWKCPSPCWLWEGVGSFWASPWRQFSTK